MAAPRHGPAIPGRGVPSNGTAVEQMLNRAAQADAPGAFHSLGAGGSLFARPRRESRCSRPPGRT